MTMGDAFYQMGISMKDMSVGPEWHLHYFSMVTDLELSRNWKILIIVNDKKYRGWIRVGDLVTEMSEVELQRNVDRIRVLREQYRIV